MHSAAKFVHWRKVVVRLLHFIGLVKLGTGGFISARVAFLLRPWSLTCGVAAWPSAQKLNLIIIMNVNITNYQLQRMK